MGANTYDRQNYWTIVSGRLWTKLEKNHPEAVRREYTDKQNETHEMYGKWADSWTGLITDIQRREGNFGAELNIFMRDEKEDCVISTKLDSGFGMDFMRRVCSPDFDTLEDTEVRPFSFEDDETKKTKSFLILKQKGKKIMSPFSKENPLPEWEEITFRGQKKWDNSKQIEYLYEHAKSVFTGTNGMTKPPIKTEKQPVTSTFENEPDLDDLPF